MKVIDFIKKANANWVIVITLIAATWVNFNIVFWQSKKVIAWDVAFYYNYLPSVVYHHDISQEFLRDTINHEIKDRYFSDSRLINNKYVFKGTMGMAITYLPFFAGAHFYAKAFNYEVNGYSEPYHFAVQFSSLFYYIIGLFFLSRVLKSYFPDRISFLVLLFITIGTNALYYITIGGGMSHAVNFALMAGFIYYTIKWHENFSLKNILILGLIGGLLTLIRPINILAYLFFFLYQVKSLKDIALKLKLFLHHKFQIIIIAFAGILIFFPQLLYWKYQTGSWFFNSYIDEHFFFNNPHVFYGLFSFRKGWLLYTPIMAFALAGFYYLYKTIKDLFYPILMLLVVYLYIAFSWWCWWYGGSFGQRALIDIYPFLVIPFGAFLLHLKNASVLKRSLVYTLITLLFLLNIFQTMQAKWNIIHYDSMTKDAYFDAFLRLTKNPEREKFLKDPDEDKARKGLEEY